MKGIDIKIDTKNKNVMVFEPTDFEMAVGEPVSERIKENIKKLNLEYVDLTPKERDDCINASVKILMSPLLDRSGEEKLNNWEKGWSENLKLLKKNGLNGLIPAYCGNDDIVRFRQKYIKPLKKGFDHNILYLILDWLFEKYAPNAESIYEFGCGTGYHLPHLREHNKTAKLFGLDWAKASQMIIKEMVAQGIVENAFGINFDFFNPDKSLALDKNSVIYTCGGLEQVGIKHEKFLEYVLDNSPKVCFHVEAIGELLDESNLLDSLTKQYFKKRNYLDNFIVHLRNMEADGKIKIDKIIRTYLGGNLFTEYMIVVWAPVI